MQNSYSFNSTSAQPSQQYASGSATTWQPAPQSQTYAYSPAANIEGTMLEGQDDSVIHGDPNAYYWQRPLQQPTVGGFTLAPLAEDDDHKDPTPAAVPAFPAMNFADSDFATRRRWNKKWLWAGAGALALAGVGGGVGAYFGTRKKSPSSAEGVVVSTIVGQGTTVTSTISSPVTTSTRSSAAVTSTSGRSTTPTSTPTSPAQGRTSTTSSRITTSTTTSATTSSRSTSPRQQSSSSSTPEVTSPRSTMPPSSTVIDTTSTVDDTGPSSVVDSATSTPTDAQGASTSFGG